jgi:uncharacterized membrane protein YkoI
VASWAVGDATLADLITRAPVIFDGLGLAALGVKVGDAKQYKGKRGERSCQVHAFSLRVRRRQGMRKRIMWRVLKPTLIAALAAACFAAAGQAGGGGCVEWKNAGPIIAQNGLMPAAMVYQMVQQKFGGKVVNQTLCNMGGQFVYKLVVLGPTGDVTNVTVDAKTGQF